MSETTITTNDEAMEVIKTQIAETVEVNATEMEVIKAELAEANAAIELQKSESAEALSVMKSAHAEEMEVLNAKFDATPVIENKSQKEIKMTTYTQSEEQASKFLATVELTKAVTSNADIAGAPESSGATIHPLAQVNLLRNHADVWNTATGVVKLPSIDTGAFAEEGTVDLNRTQGGSLASKTIVAKTMVSSNQVSKSSADDIADLDAKMESKIVQDAGVAELAICVAALEAETGFAAVQTGVSGDLPTTGTMMIKIAEMVAALGSAYRGNAKFFMSREAYAAIRGSDNSGLNIDPMLGGVQLFGYEVVIIDTLADGSTAGDVAVYFGDMQKALVIASRKTLEVSRYMETAPGFVTYHADFRTNAASHDLLALVALETSA